MTKWRVWSVPATALLLVAAVAGPALGGDEITVGDFIQNLALDWKVDATDVASGLQALKAVGAGPHAELDLRKPLTEGDVVALAATMNLRLSTSDPERAFTGRQAERFLAVFGKELGRDHSPRSHEAGGESAGDGPPQEWPGQGQGPGFNPFVKGKGKGKGNVSPSDP